MAEEWCQENWQKAAELETLASLSPPSKRAPKRNKAYYSPPDATTPTSLSPAKKYVHTYLQITLVETPLSDLDGEWGPWIICIFEV